MQMTRTTLRLDKQLKLQAERFALEEERTLQDILNTALREYLTKTAKKKAKKITFKAFDLGVPLDNLTRDSYYNDPR